jgi:hypothetical protein
MIRVLSVMGLYLSHALPVDLFRPYARSPKGHEQIEADAVVAQHFEGRAASISKYKQGAGERIFRQFAFAKRCKPIDAVAEVDRLAG